MPLEQCYLLGREIFANRPSVTLVSRQRGKRAGLRWACDFELLATLSPLGAIAQLGERLAGSQKVAGSSPAGSTSETRLNCGFFP